MMSRIPRLFRFSALLASGVVILQAGGCTFFQLNEVLQTVLLGITAVGAIEIIQNV